jgi:hypothetical protein
MRIVRLLQLFAAAGLFLSASATQASFIGTDNAAQSTYNDGWQTGDDGAATGDAFGAWTLTTNTSGTGFAGHFIGDSKNLSGGSGADINTSGKSFGMYGGKGDGTGEANAFRSFNGGGLTIGQTFSMDIAVNYRNGFKGVDIRDAGNSLLFNLGTSGDDYTVFSSSFTGSIGSSYSSNTAFSIALTQTSGTGGSWVVTRTGGVSDSDSGSYTGVPTNIKLYVSQTDTGSENDFYANSMAIVPEPASMMLWLLGAVACGAFRRRSQQQ